MTYCPYKEIRAQTHTEGRLRDDKEKTATCKPMTKALEETRPDDT